MDVHQLKARDFVLHPWQPIASFPRDGTTVEVEDEHGDVYLAGWHDGRIIIDAAAAVRPVNWRVVS